MFVKPRLGVSSHHCYPTSPFLALTNTLIYMAKIIIIIPYLTFLLVSLTSLNFIIKKQLTLSVLDQCTAIDVLMAFKVCSD